MAKKYGWEDVYAGRPVGETWLGKEPLATTKHKNALLVWWGGMENWLGDGVPRVQC